MEDKIQNLIENLPDDDVEAWKIICEESLKVLNARPASDSIYRLYALVLSMLESRPIGLKLAPPQFEKLIDRRGLIRVLDSVSGVVNSTIRKRTTQKIFEESLEHYKATIRPGFFYEFLESDYTRLQELINEIRTLTNESNQIDSGHKKRLLKKLEKLQQELNKKMSNVDAFWGLMGEAGVALGKFGQDIKPLTDRIREILQIVYRTQARANELPSGKEKPLLQTLNSISADDKADKSQAN